MKNLLRSKTTIATIVIVIILVVVYFYYQGGSSSSSGSLLSSPTSDQAVGSAELALLNQIKSLKIDTSLFQDPVYQSLVDYSVPIPPENVGRPNPFAPYPGEVVTSPTASAASGAGSASHSSP